MNESGHIVKGFNGEKENTEGQTRFTKPPKKAKVSSRSFALIKKAVSKIGESLAQKMEAQKVELAKQYQEAHETVRAEAQNQNTKNRDEYDGDRLQRLTNALGSIGVKLILSDYAASRLSVYGQPKAIKTPNFWGNIKIKCSYGRQRI